MVEEEWLLIHQEANVIIQYHRRSVVGNSEKKEEKKKRETENQNTERKKKKSSDTKMARKSGILIRHLFGNWSNPCAGLLHHRRLVFSRPAKMVIISNKDDYDRAIKQVTDGLLPAVFYFIDQKCIPDSSYEPALILRALRMNFPHVTIYKIIKPPVADMEEILGNMVPDYRVNFKWKYHWLMW